MLLNIPLHFFPTTPHCLAWSPRGDLAIATGEHVHILIPNYSCTPTTPNTPAPTFFHVHLRINSFCMAEWPMQQPAALAHLSLGEEQSASVVVGLAWSAEGVGTAGRCVLAVLGSNCVIGVWESVFDPKDVESWRRVGVVDGWGGWRVGGGKEGEKLKGDRLGEDRIRGRVRAMAWSSLKIGSGDGVGGKRMGMRDGLDVRKGGRENITMAEDQDMRILLAIMNDLKEVFLLQVRSPFLARNSKRPWTVEVLSRSSRPAPLAESHEDEEFEKEAWHRQRADGELEFGPWTSTGSDVCSKLTCRSNGVVRTWIIDASKLQLEDPCEIEHADEILTWDQLPAYGNIPRTLIQMMSDAQRSFSDEHNLDGHVNMRIWGLAHFQDCLAVCITLHPSNMIEYTINSSESATLLFTKDQPGEEDYSGQDGQFPWESKLAIERPEVTGRAAWSNVKAIERLDIVMRNGFHRKLLYGILCATFLWPNHNDKDIDDIRAVLLSCAMVTNVNFNQEILALTELASREEDRRSNLDILNALVLERSLHEDEKTVGLDEQFLQYCQLSSCRLPLQWKGMNIARCSRGHEWDRCSLSFLVLHKPGISKSCEACERKYYDEDKVDVANYLQPPPFDANAGKHTRRNGAGLGSGGGGDMAAIEAESDPDQDAYGESVYMAGRLVFETVLRTLYQEFDRCIFCKGRFIS